MRKLLVSAAMIGLIAGLSPVLAQDREHQDQGGLPHEQHASPPPRGGQRPQASPEHGPRPQPQAQRRPENRPPPNNNAARGAPGPAMRGPANAMRGPGPRDFSSARNYHQNFNAARRFHAAPYRPPPGFYAHHWGWGETLPRLFWARQYWLLNFAAYALPPPPFGAVWVRVGSDALLIDQTSGMIIEVDYGVFY